MRLAFINVGNDSGLEGNANRKAYPPLGIISLATAVRSMTCGGDIEMLLIDGQVDSQESVLNQLRAFRPTLTAISMYCLSLRNAYHLAREAAALGSTVVLGNDHASFHWRTILRQLPEVNFICVEDEGETVITQLVEYALGMRKLAAISGVAYRDRGEYVRVPLQRSEESAALPSRSALDGLGIPDRSLLPNRYWQCYLDAFLKQKRRVFDTRAVQGVTTINRGRGCRRVNDMCRYCGIADLRPRGSSAEVFWADVGMAREQVGANVIYEAFDSASSWPQLIEDWARRRPAPLSDSRFMLYAQARESTPRVVDAFKKLGVFCVNTGMDSGDDEALALLKGPRDSVQHNRNAALAWSEAGIEMHISFVLIGLGDEKRTHASLQRTIEFAEFLVRETLAVSLDSALLYPDISSRLGRMIWEPEQSGAVQKDGWDFIDLERLEVVSRRWRNELILDPLEMCADFAWICRTDPEVLLEYNRQIAGIADQGKINFGQSQGGNLPVA